VRNSLDFLKVRSGETSAGRPKGKTEWLVWLVQIPGGNKAGLVGAGLALEEAVKIKEARNNSALGAAE
jgi:hypothetical protein